MDILQASEIGDLEKVLQLIEEGVNLNIKDSCGYTAIMWASTNDDLEIVNVLIIAGADINIQNIYKSTPLMRASSQNNLDIVKELINAGANLDIQNNNGSTALIWASFNCYLEIIRTLIKAGANTDLKNSYNECALYHSLNYNNNYKIPNLLLKSIKNFNKECLKFKKSGITFFYLFPFIKKSKKCLINKIPDDLIGLLLKF